MVKTAIIGLGKAAADIHLPACQMVSDIEVAAGCDPVPERRKEMAQRFAIPTIYDEPLTMLEKENPDLVIICTPPHTHRDLSLLALRHGAHVLCEKPFVNSLDEAEEVISCAENAGRLIVVNNQYRYMDIYRHVQEQIGEGQYGRPYFLQCWQQMYHPPGLDGTPWRRELKQATLFEFGTHVLDLICYFFGALPSAVNAVIPRVRSDYDTDDLVQMTLYFPEERLATIALNRVSHAPERYMEMRLDCDEASLRISVGGLARASVAMTRYRGKSRPSPRFSFVRGGEARLEIGSRSSVIAREPKDARASATARLLRDVMPEMRKKSPSLERARHARDLMRIVFAGYESAQKRQVIELS